MLFEHVFGEGNNTLAEAFTLGGNTDLVPVTASTSNALAPNSSATLTVVVANQGPQTLFLATGPLLSVQLVPSSGGTPLSIGSAVHTSLFQAGSQLTLSVPVTIPALLAGQYSVHVVADPSDLVPESYDGPQGETNNTLVTGLTMSVITPPPPASGADLAVASISIGKANVPQDSLVMSYTFKNQGTAPVIASSGAPFWFTVCPSYDRVTPISPTCSSGGRVATTIQAGQSVTVSETVALYCELQSFYLIVMVDSRNGIGESNESNNVAVSKAMPVKCP
jgi:subtilase family serine protease